MSQEEMDADVVNEESTDRQDETPAVARVAETVSVVYLSRRGNQTTKFFPWNLRMRVSSLKRKVAREFLLPNDIKFSFAGEDGSRIQRINVGDTIHIKIERGRRGATSRGGDWNSSDSNRNSRDRSRDRRDRDSRDRDRVGKTAEERRAAALKMLLSCLEV